MTAGDLLWPGLHRAGDLFTDAAVVAAMVRVEAAWLETLTAAGLAPQGSAKAVAAVQVSREALDDLRVSAESGGNPVIPLLALIRVEVDGPVHLSLTSQDVVDTALLLCARDCLDAVDAELGLQLVAGAKLAEDHRHTLMTARTLGQAAVPTTFGARVAGWLRGLMTARDGVQRVRADLPAQVGGAGGTLAATVEVCRAAGAAEPVAAAEGLVRDFAGRLGLRAAEPWHTTRAPVTRVADALVEVCDALGKVANDVAQQSRPELSELREPAAEGRGGSSAMPQKRNPVLSVLIRRQAMSAPLMAAQLHLAAGAAVDERPDGAWHTEWAPLRDLSQRTVAATRQATELLEGLEVDATAMRRHVDDALTGLLAERAATLQKCGVEPPVDTDPAAYLGLAEQLVDRAVAAERAEARGSDFDQAGAP